MCIFELTFCFQFLFLFLLSHIGFFPNPLDESLGGRIKAVTHLSLVRVRRVRVDALVVVDVLEGFVHEAAVAAVVSVLSGTVHQVLGAEVHQLPGLLGQLALQGPDGTEGPAGAARTLDSKEGGLLWCCSHADISFPSLLSHKLQLKRFTFPCLATQHQFVKDAASRV